MSKKHKKHEIVEEEEEEDEEVVVAEEDVYVVEAIVGHKVDRKGKVLYCVKWEGYPSSDNTWEPEENFGDHNVILTEYKIKKGLMKPSDVAPPTVIVAARDDDEEEEEVVEEVEIDKSHKKKDKSKKDKEKSKGREKERSKEKRKDRDDRDQSRERERDNDDEMRLGKTSSAAEERKGRDPSAAVSTTAGIPAAGAVAAMVDNAMDELQTTRSKYEQQYQIAAKQAQMPTAPGLWCAHYVTKNPTDKTVDLELGWMNMSTLMSSSSSQV